VPRTDQSLLQLGGGLEQQQQQQLSSTATTYAGWLAMAGDVCDHAAVPWQAAWCAVATNNTSAPHRECNQMSLSTIALPPSSHNHLQPLYRIQSFIYMDVSFYPITAFTPPHVWRHGSRTSTMPALLTHNSVNCCQPLPDGRTASCTGAADSARLMGQASAATPVIGDASRDTRMLSEPLAASPSPSHLHTQHNHAQGQASNNLTWVDPTTSASTDAPPSLAGPRERGDLDTA
jgi:hypothetical protein